MCFSLLNVQLFNFRHAEQRNVATLFNGQQLSFCSSATGKHLRKIRKSTEQAGQRHFSKLLPALFSKNSGKGVVRACVR